jgi:hypothetical protein
MQHFFRALMPSVYFSVAGLVAWSSFYAVAMQGKLARETTRVRAPTGSFIYDGMRIEGSTIFSFPDFIVNMFLLLSALAAIVLLFPMWFDSLKTHVARFASLAIVAVAVITMTGSFDTFLKGAVLIAILAIPYFAAVHFHALVMLSVKLFPAIFVVSQSPNTSDHNNHQLEKDN